MLQSQKIIEKLGYSPNEAKVYLTALTLGDANISDIAAGVNLPRTTTQAIVDKLHTVGLMNFYVQRRYKYWVAERPERLLLAIRRNEEAVMKVIPRLTEIRRSRQQATRAQRAMLPGMGLLRIFADTVEQPALIGNLKTEIQYANAAWEELFGYTLEEVIGVGGKILQSDETPESERVEMQRLLKAGKLFQSDKIVQKRKNGTLIRIRTTIFVVNHEGAPYYVQILDRVSDFKK